MSTNRLRVGESVKTSHQELYVGWPDGSRRRLDDKTLTQLAAMEQDVSTYLQMLGNLLKTLQVTRQARKVLDDEIADKKVVQSELAAAMEAKQTAPAGEA